MRCCLWQLHVLVGKEAPKDDAKKDDNKDKSDADLEKEEVRAGNRDGRGGEPLTCSSLTLRAGACCLGRFGMRG